MKLRLRPGSEALREAYRIWPDPLAEMRSFACDKHGWLAAQQLLRGGSGKVTASSPGSASAKIKNAWSDRDLCSKGDQEPPERSVGCRHGLIALRENAHGFVKCCVRCCIPCRIISNKVTHADLSLAHATMLELAQAHALT